MKVTGMSNTVYPGFELFNSELAVERSIYTIREFTVQAQASGPVEMQLRG
jgi:hypothetical protein